MRALIAVLASLALVTNVDAAVPIKASGEGREKSDKDMANLVNKRVFSERFAAFPATPAGAPRNVRRALCPKSIDITGINKRALGCTISDIFGPSNLSQRYLRKLRGWAKDMSAKNAGNPNGFKPEVDLNLEALEDVEVKAMQDTMTKGVSERLGREWNANRFSDKLIPLDYEIPEKDRFYEAKEVVQDPETELQEEEMSVEDLFESPGLKIKVEIPQEELPWNVPEAEPMKDVGTRTTTADPFTVGRTVNPDEELVPTSGKFRGFQ